jgi:3-dehydroquinate dehydratase
MLALKRELKIPVTYHAAGSVGSMSRIINPMLGGHMIFCVDRFGVSSTPEQLDLRAAKSVVENIKHMMGE